MVQSMLEWLQKRGHECHVLTTSPMLGGTVAEEYQNDILVRAIYSDAERVAEYEWADVLITHLDMTTSCCKWASQVGLPVVHVVHNANQLKWHKLTSHQVQLVIYNSYWLAQKVAFPAPSLVVYPPVFTQNYQPTKEDLLQDRNRITLINLNDNKGGALLWNWARLWPDRLFLGVPGAYGDQHLGPPGGLPNVDLVTHGTDMRAIYARSLVVVVPSESETWGRVAIEAMAAGVPVIASPTTGLQEAVGSGGLFCDRNQADSWGDALDLLEDPTNWQIVSTQGRSRALDLERVGELQLRAMETVMLSICSRSSVRVWALASESHYVDHISPVFHAINPMHRGFVMAQDRRSGNYWPAMRRCLELGLPCYPIAGIHSSKQEPVGLGEGSLVYVVSQRDKGAAEKLGRGQIVRGEHGAGQSYSGSGSTQNPSFIGSDSHRGCVAAMVPSLESATTLREAGFKDPICIIGCPKLESFAVNIPDVRFIAGAKPKITFTFRYADKAEECPEMGSAWPHWASGLEDLHATGKYEIYLHAHPRAWTDFPELHAAAKRLGICLLPSFEDVLKISDILICDNSSVAVEWMAIKNRGLILINAPGYRRWVKHGLRFWEMQNWPGVHLVEKPELFKKTVDSVIAGLATEGVGSPPIPWYDPPVQSLDDMGSVRAAVVMEHLLSQGESVTVRILRSCDGSHGKLLVGEVRLLATAYADELAKRSMVTLLTRGEPGALTSNLFIPPPSWPAGCWETLRIYEVEGWRRRP